MARRVFDTVRAAALVLCLLFALLRSLRIYAEEEVTYRFERMWPTLQQPWYFWSPRDAACDSSGNVYVVNSGKKRRSQVHGRRPVPGQVVHDRPVCWR